MVMSIAMPNLGARTPPKPNREPIRYSRAVAANMLGISSFSLDHMALALVLWLCTLPLAGLLIVPFFGLKIAALAAIALLVAPMAICWGICSWKLYRE